MPASRTTNAMGVTATVLGGLALALCWIPYINVVSILLGGIGLVLALGGLLMGLVDRKSGLGSPITGLFLSVLSVAVAIFVTSAFVEMRRELERAKAEAGGSAPLTARE
jgi:hypothetical protein